jgi:hypothetical protein
MSRTCGSRARFSVPAFLTVATFTLAWDTRITSVKFQDILDTLFQDILDSFGVCKERVESGFWEYLGGG